MATGLDSLTSKLSGEKGVRNPGALAAAIGRKKQSGVSAAMSGVKKVSVPGAPAVAEELKAPKLKTGMGAPAIGTKIKSLQDLRNLAKAKGY